MKNPGGRICNVVPPTRRLTGYRSYCVRSSLSLLDMHDVYVPCVMQQRFIWWWTAFWLSNRYTIIRLNGLHSVDQWIFDELNEGKTGETYFYGFTDSNVNGGMSSLTGFMLHALVMTCDIYSTRKFRETDKYFSVPCRRKTGEKGIERPENMIRLSFFFITEYCKLCCNFLRFY